MKTIIVLFGNTGDGRRTVADYISEKYDAELMNFSDPINEFIQTMIGIPSEWLNAPKAVREASKVYGVPIATHQEELMRLIEENERQFSVWSKSAWMTKLADKIDVSHSEQFVIADGNRPAEEIHEFREMFPKDWNILNVLVRNPSNETRVGFNHREQAMRDYAENYFDYVILNDGNLEKLYARVDAVCQYLLEIEVLKREGRRGFIRTFTGERYFPLKPRSQDVTLPAIAHGLARTARWNRQGKAFLSVARHSINVADEVEAILSTESPWRSQSLSAIDPKLARLYALLHDAHEAYLSDIPSPVKAQIPRWGEIERANDKAIFSYFGIEELAFDPVSYACKDREQVKQLRELVHLVDRQVAAKESQYTTHDPALFKGMDISLVDVPSEWGSNEKDVYDFEEAVRTAYQALHGRELP